MPPRRNYGFEKRQKDQARKDKQEEKRAAREKRKADRAAGLDPDLADAADLEALGLGPSAGGDDADAEDEEADEDEETTSSNGGDPR